MKEARKDVGHQAADMFREGVVEKVSPKTFFAKLKQNKDQRKKEQC